MKEFVKKLLPAGWGQLTKHVTSGVCEGSAKAENLLKLLGGIEHNRICPGRAGGWEPGDRRGGRKTLVSIRDAHRNAAGGYVAIGILHRLRETLRCDCCQPERRNSEEVPSRVFHASLS